MAKPAKKYPVQTYSCLVIIPATTLYPLDLIAQVRAAELDL